MAEVYVTLSEAAELEGVQYKTMARRTQRNKKNFVTKTEKSENGGKDVVLVAVSSLSKQARNAWKEREKLKSFTEEFPDKKEDEQKPEVPWYVNTDVDWYIENYKERYYKAVELGNVVRKFLQYDEGDRTKYAEEFAQHLVSTSMGSMQVTLQSLRRRSESFLPLPEALLKVRNRRTAYLQEQAHSRRRWSSLRAETLCRSLVCVRHVRSTWGLG